MRHDHDPNDFDSMAWCYDWVPVPTHGRRLRKRLGPIDGVVVDLGGGTGKYSVRVFDPKRTRIVVVDIARKMLQRGVKKRRDIRPLQGSAGLVPLTDGSASAVITTEAFHHFAGIQDQVLAEAARILRDDGILLIEEPNPRKTLGRLMRWGEHRGEMHSHFIPPAELSAMVARHFHEVRDARSGLFTYIVEGRGPRRG